MIYDNDIDKAAEASKKAFARLQKDGIVPTPTNYEVLYVYYANIHQDLKTELADILSKNDKVCEEDCHILYDKYLSDKKHQDIYQKAGDQIHSTLQDMSGLINNVKTVTSEYNGTLEGVNEKLTSAKSKDDIEQVLQSVVADTARIMEQNKKLEAELDKSANVMGNLQQDLERIRKEAMTDGLTGLANRKSFDEKIKKITETCQEQGKGFTLLMVDIDHFKSFNDNFGHQVGDQVLRLVAMTLTDGVKGKDFAARYGGEEFAIILPDTNLNGGVIVGNNLRQSLEHKEIINRSNGENLGRITMSVGAAQYYEGESVEGLIERADAALYTAKHNGRNQVAAAPTPHEVKQKSTG